MQEEKDTDISTTGLLHRTLGVGEIKLRHYPLRAVENDISGRNVYAEAICGYTRDGKGVSKAFSSKWKNHQPLEDR